MGNEEILGRLQQNNARGEEIVKFIQQQLPLLQKAAAEKHQAKLAAEIKEKNQLLKRELEFWRNKVTELEVMSGIKQVPMPSDNINVSNVTKVAVQNCTSSANITDDKINSKPEPTVTKVDATAPSKKDLNQAKKESKKEKAGKVSKSDKQPPEENKEINVSRLDLRIGRILNAKRHPDAESLYVEEIDVGEDKPRTVVSGLVKFVPLEEMQDRLVVVLCNLKPAKMRGVTSEAMVMCASTPEKVEILTPPPDSLPGDRVVCDEYPGEPDSLLNPKKKIFEQVAPDLKTDGSCNATYKLAVLKVANKGIVKSTTLTDVQIK